jgi:hypothetical protein
MSTLAPLDLPLPNIVQASAAYSANYLDTVLCNTTSAAFTVTLPDANAMPGRAIVVYLQVHGSGNSVTIAPSESQDINGAGSNLTLSSANTAYCLLSVGSAGWLALSGLLAQ